MKTFDQLTEEEKDEEMKKFWKWLERHLNNAVIQTIKSGVPTQKQEKD